jgi:hypothetical protein
MRSMDSVWALAAAIIGLALPGWGTPIGSGLFGQVLPDRGTTLVLLGAGMLALLGLRRYLYR